MSMKTINRIFWVIEYWLKTLEYESWSANTKLFFWETEAKFETLQKLSPYLWVTYRFVLKCVKSRNRTFWATEYWLKTLEYKIWLTNARPFFSENRRNLGTLQKFSPYIGFTYNVVLKCVKGRNRIFWAIEYWYKTLECQIWSTNRKLFSWESETKLQILQKRSLYIGVSYKLFWSLPKA